MAPHSSLTPPADSLRAKLDSGTALIGVIGLGYVGLPLAHVLHAGGWNLLGFDIDGTKLDHLRRGHNYLRHFGDAMARDLGTSPRFSGTTDFARLGEPDVLIICLPTPLGKHLEPDLSYIRNCGHDIGRTLRPGQLIILESTSYPGTTRDDLHRAICETASTQPAPLELGRDYFLAFSPEREDPGRTSHTTRTIPKLVGGLDALSTELACKVYAKGVESVIPVSSAEIAEAAKLLENIFRSVNIAMVNELKVVLGAMGIDIWEVIAASSTKPFGFMPFYPGPGLGGHCIPIDPFYLTWKAREFGLSTRFIELAGEINTRMPHFVIDRLSAALNVRGRAVRDARVLVLGLSYKPDIDDIRESPSFVLIELLQDLGAHVDYSDPHVPRTMPMRKHDLDMASIPLTAESLATYDAVLIATRHTAFNYALIAQHARLIVDTRNAMSPFASQLGDRLVKA